MKRLLSFKGWQLFILIVICGAWISPSPAKEIINGVAVVTFTSWIYAIGVYGQYRIAELGLKTMNVKFFKANVIIVLGLWLLLLIYFGTRGQIKATNASQPVYVILNIAVLYLFFAMFQTIIFACKTIATIELRRDVSFGDYFTNLLLMGFFFVGIWILQPKINRFIGTARVVRNPASSSNPTHS
jgi:hypothetical protein